MYIVLVYYGFVLYARFCVYKCALQLYIDMRICTYMYMHICVYIYSVHRYIIYIYMYICILCK